MFNVGDRVRYKMENPRNDSYTHYKAGLVGTVCELRPALDKDYVTVLFDKEQSSHSDRVGRFLYGVKSGCYSVNLEYISFKYDPTQAGDTDEDI